MSIAGCFEGIERSRRGAVAGQLHGEGGPLSALAGHPDRPSQPLDGLSSWPMLTHPIHRRPRVWETCLPKRLPCRTPSFVMQRARLVPLALALLAAHLGGALHLALVAHSTCLEHGQLVEAPAGTPERAIGPRNRPSGRAELDSETTDLSSLEHGHCLVQAHRREWARLDEPPVVCSLLPLTHGVRGGQLPGAFSFSPLQVAPKQSPPL